MSRFVQYQQFGGPEVLEIVEVEPPHPGAGQVRVRVFAAGLNPVDFKIYHGGPAAAAYGAVVPSGVGNDFSGVIDELGEGVTDWSLGEEVLGGSRNFAEADFVVVDAGVLTRKPAGMSFEAAGSLAVAGRTAWASVNALKLTSADTVLVSAAAGGVGVLAAQLARATGASVIGTASSANHDYLRSLGVVPVGYGDGLAERIREVSPEGITAVLDNHGPATIETAIELGVPLDRINTIAAHGYDGVLSVGGAAATADDLSHVAQLIADGDLELPIDSIYPLERVREAYERLEAGHVRGKIVLVTE
ncbi:MAG TPA: NADP-dependent oxidoreductase [Microbacteriaceae bacterium]